MAHGEGVNFGFCYIHVYEATTPASHVHAETNSSLDHQPQEDQDQVTKIKCLLRVKLSAASPLQTPPLRW